MKRMRCVQMLLAGLACLLLAPVLQAAGDEGIVPGDYAVTTWRKTGPPKLFTGSDLYGYIDGGAELFIEFGFEALTVQRYTYGKGEFVLELYRMTDPEAAAGIYLMKCGHETPDPALKERHTCGQYQLTMVKNRYFLIINNQRGYEQLVPDLAKFAKAVAARIPAAPPLAVLDRLPKADRVEDSIRLSRGPYALQAVYVFGDGDLLQLGGKITAVSAQYQAGPDSRTLILVDYPTAEAATRALANLEAGLDYYLKPLLKNDRRLVFQDFAQKYGDVVREGTALRLTVNLTARPKMP